MLSLRHITPAHVPHQNIVWVLGIVIVGLLLGHASKGRAAPPAVPSPSSSTSTQAAASTAQNNSRLQAPLLDWSHALFAHHLMEQWLNEGKVDPAGQSLKVSDLYGLRVTFRIAGHTVGVGEAYRQDAAAVVDQVGPPVDLVPLLAQAGRQAIQELRGHLEDARYQAVLGGHQTPGAPPPKITDVAHRVLIGIQLARHLVTIRIPDHADPGALFGKFAPGFHGLRMTAAHAAGVAGNTGDAKVRDAVMWPATALASDIAPKSQIIQLLADLGYQPQALLNVARPEPGAPGLERFEIIHAVRPRPASPVTHLVRGNLVLPPLAVDDRTLENIAFQLTMNLKRRFTPDAGVRGTYHPTSNRYDPPYATEDEVGLACYALVRRGRYLAQSGPADTVANRLIKLGRDTAMRLVKARADGKGGFKLDPGAGALLMLTLIDQPHLTGEDAAMCEAMGKWLLRLANPNGGFRDSASPKAKTVNHTTQALVAAALAAWYRQTRTPAAGKAVSQTLDFLWRSSAGNPNVAALPWLVMAQNRAGALLTTNDADGAKRLKAREQALGDLVDKLAKQQVIEPPLLGPADVVGGFELRKGPPGSPPNPDWRSVWLLQFLGECLQKKDIRANHDSMGWLLTAGLAARFMGQLMMTQPSCYYVSSMDDALYGMRLTLWDNTEAVSATAQSLLAVTQLQEAIRDMSP